MRSEITEQHPLFKKYTQAWLHRVTGFTKGYLSRVSTGRVSLSRPFIERVCYKLGLPEEELFSPQAKRLPPCGCSNSRLGNWLEEKCQSEHLSSREAAARTGLSHATIRDIIKGNDPLPETIRKLARAFSADGISSALEDYLLILAGYRTKPEKQPTYLEVIPLLSPQHQHLIRVLVRKLAEGEGIEVAPF